MRDVENAQHAVLQVQSHGDDGVEAANEKPIDNEISDKGRRREQGHHASSRLSFALAE